MKDADLIQALKRMGVQTGGLICLGCGHEHNCGVHGCAVIREAAQRLEERLKYQDAIARMGKFGQLFVEYEGCPRGAMGRMCDATIQEEALAMDMLTDVDMGRWRPVNEDVLQELLRKGVIETGKEQNGELLTLDQLREMDGKPVWIVEWPKWGHWELSENGEDYLAERDLELYGVTGENPNGYGWLAYTYPPAHIDREAWKPCSVCDEFDTCDWREDSGCKKRKKG